MKIGEASQVSYARGRTPSPGSTATMADYGPKTRNSQGLTGMDITGMTAADFKIVPVSDEIRNALVNQERKDFLENYGMSDGEELSALIRKYIAGVPESQRINVGWTLNQISLNEAQRLTDLAKERIPGWQAGKPFDRNIFSDIMVPTSRSLDKKI